MSETTKKEWRVTRASATGTDHEKSDSPAEAKTKAQVWVEKIRTFRHRIPWAVRLPVAIVFLVLGFLGLFLPILQGGLFLFIAAWLLFPDHSERLLAKIKAWLTKKKKS